MVNVKRYKDSVYATNKLLRPESNFFIVVKVKPSLNCSNWRTSGHRT